MNTCSSTTCQVREHCGGTWLVTFKAGRQGPKRRLLLQGDHERAALAVATGHLRAPRDWDGNPRALPGWGSVEPRDIRTCPADYRLQAQED